MTQPYSEVTGSFEGRREAVWLFWESCPSCRAKHLSQQQVLTQLLTQPDWLISGAWRHHCLQLPTPLLHQRRGWLNRMIEFGFQLEETLNHLISPPLPWTGTPSTNPGCSNTHPTGSWMPRAMGYPQRLWATCSAPYHPQNREFLSNILSKPALFQFNAIPPCSIVTCSCKKSLRFCTSQIYSTGLFLTLQGFSNSSTQDPFPHQNSTNSWQKSWRD